MSAIADDKKRILESKLRDVVTHNSPPNIVLRNASSDSDSSVPRQVSVTSFIDNISAFLLSWDELTSQDGLPCETLRHAFYVLLNNYRPREDHTIVCPVFLKTLATIKATESQKILLEFLPSIIRPAGFCKDREEVTAQVLQILNYALAEYPTVFLLVLGCISEIPLSPMGNSEVLTIALRALPIVPDEGLPPLVEFIFTYTSTEDQALRAVKALRSQMCCRTPIQYLVQSDAPEATNAKTQTQMQTPEGKEEKSLQDYKSELEPGSVQDMQSETGEAPGTVNDCIAFVANNFLDILTKEGIGDLVAKAYLVILTHPANIRDESSITETKIEAEETHQVDKFIFLDIVVMLVLFQHPGFTNLVQNAADSMLQNNTFPYREMVSFIHLTYQKRIFGRSTSYILLQQVFPALLSMSIFLLLAPVRLTQVPEMDKVMSKTEELVINLYQLVDNKRQEELIHCLLQIEDKSIHSAWDSRAHHQQRQSNILQFNTLAGLNRTSEIESGKETPYFQVVINAAVNRILRALAKSPGGSLTRFKHIFIARLDTQVSISDKTWCNSLIEELCSILVALCEYGSVASSELLTILQKLLFTSSQTLCDTSQRVIKGLILSKELIACPAISQNEKEIMKQWVLRIILPTTRRPVSPEIGLLGLHFLESMIESSEKQATFSDCMSLLKADIFQQTKNILANTGLVQLLTDYKQTKSRGKTVLGYMFNKQNEMVDSKRAGNDRDLVFCVSYFMQHSCLDCPSRWNKASSWVFYLVDAYLRMGRASSVVHSNVSNKKRKGKWLPNGWLRAGLEFPFVDFSGVKGKDEERNSEFDWILTQFCRHEVPAEKYDQSGSIDRVLVEFFANVNSIDQLSSVNQAIQRFSLAVLLSIGVSLAVLKNSFSHYLRLVPSSLNDNKAKEDGLKLLRLLQYQCMKLYNLKRKSELVECLLRAVKSTALKSNPSPKRSRHEFFRQKRFGKSVTTEFPCENDNQHRRAMKLAQGVDSVLMQMKQIRSAFFSEDYIQINALWECLIDADQDREIFSAVDSILDATIVGERPNKSGLFQLVEMRKSLLEHLVDLHSKFELHSMVCSVCPVHRPYFAHCVQMGKYLSLRVPSPRGERDKQGGWDSIFSSLAAVAATYFQLVYTILVNRYELSKSCNIVSSRSSDLTFKDCLVLCQNIFGASTKDSPSPLKRVGFGAETNSREDFCINTVFSGFLELLRKSNDASISIQLLEILSMLALYSGESLIEEVACASWVSLHTLYLSFDIGLRRQLPFAMMKALKRPCFSHSTHLCLRVTVKKMIRKTENECGDKFWLRYSILRHCGLLICSGVPFALVDDHLSSMLEELSDLLEGLHEQPRMEQQRKKRLDLRNVNAGDKNLPRRQRCSSRSSIQGLNTSTLAVLFELLLDTIVATTAVFSPSITKCSESCSNPRDSNPFGHLGRLAQLFSAIIDLYNTKLQVFPRLLLPIFFETANEMITVATFQFQSCIEWHNSRLLTSEEERARATDDPAPLKYLENLSEDFEAGIVWSLFTFCDIIEEELASDLKKEHSRYDTCDQNGVSDFDLQHQTIRDLRLSADRLLWSIKEVAQSNCRNPLNTETDPQCKEMAVTKKRKSRREQVEPHRLNARFGGSSHDQPRPKKQVQWSIQNSFNPSHNGYSSDDSSSQLSDSFAVTGHWGDNLDDSSSSGSLELEGSIEA